jgi:NADP-dependent aldehyde dehydrogenase
MAVSDVFHAVNAATGERLTPDYRESTADDVDRALRAADAAFPVYARTTPAERARFLRAIGDELVALGDALIERAHAETGLPVARLTGERGRAVQQFQLFADVLDEGSWIEARIDVGDPSRKPLAKPDLRRMLVPIGPVAVFGASNFPFAFSVPGGDTASALAAGCPVVCKAHPAHPGTSELAAQAIERAARATGMPDGVFALLHGWSNEVGLAIVRHPLTKAVGFTGSIRGGRALFDAAAARPEPIPVYAEMGSVNPVFLLPSALAERGAGLASGLAQSITVGVGQFCTNPGVLLGVRGEALDTFRAQLAEKIGASEPGVMLHGGIRAAYARGVERAQGRGATLVAAATADETRAAPTLLATDVDRFVEDPELREEMFGPASVVVVADDAGGLERAAEALEGQLTATIHGTDEELVAHARLIEILQRKVGRLVFNGFPTGVEVAHAMQHGGPYPASTDARTTSVGSAAIQRFVRPVCWQGFPQAALPVELRDRNERGILRMIDGKLTRDDV